MEETININSRLIEKCLQGDIKAQFQLYKQYSKAMYNISIRFLNNKMDAEDILQESFITAFDRLGELKNDEAFGRWLKRIVINNCISLQRKKKVHFENIEDYRFEDEADSDDVLQEIDPVIIHNAIKELPDGGRTVLVLHALEGYRHKEISEMLNISISTSKSQYIRALTILNKNLKNKVYVD